MPPISTLKAPSMYHACSGTCLGISLVRVGGSLSLALKPKKAPAKTSGTEMPNHMSSNATIVPNGTAPEDCWPHTKKLSTNSVEQTRPG
eukprot:scaffold7453_cov128-Isochrysis_galbana.AAC.14